ncbi:protein maelstrom homolog [Amphibalanus amphitrite]|uniref:protein maelstrom homolog n=1 Tax=Amphibalanus amphitrite TaxID=1232801 RepID=UPI001C924519|nr:protein maelstrom homolog [Amphibalanus amphitrite]XP_043191936.1 protein maelstrom homolog [Amphibalanus amphitrite]XP_043191937.1 protein maelstrom homolog [Amphibalanus amphitrite]
MPPKKPQINPFSMYMREQEPILRRQGIHFNSKKEVVDYLFPHFNALSEFDRQKYKNMAKIEKEKAKLDLTRKFDDRGVPLSQIAAEEDERRMKKDNMIRHVHSIVHDRSNGVPLLNVKFYNLYISLHCYTDHGKQAEYIPCEVALAEWTIADGVLRSCSYIIEPDAIPTGYRSRCLDISEATHKVPLGHPDSERSMPGVWIRLKNFINPQEELDDYPPVFTSGPDLPETEGALDWLHVRSADRRASPFRVYPLERLVYELFNAAGEPQLETHCSDLISRGHFDYFTDLACGFHQDIDNPMYCMLAKARRQAFAVLDRVAGPFGVELIPGRHVPQSKNDAGVVVNTPMAQGGGRIQFKPTREKEPDLPTQYKLLQPTRSAFRGGDWETPIGPVPEARPFSGWSAAEPEDDSTWGAAAAQQPKVRRPAALGQAAAMSTGVSQQEFPALGTAGRQQQPPPARSEADFPALGAPSETDFPALGAPGGGGLAGRSRPLATRTRVPGERPMAAQVRVPAVGRGRATSRTTVAGTLADRFAKQPGRP